MARRRHLLRASFVVCLLCPIGGPDPELSAQVTAGQNVANDPEVKGAERLFSAWLEGQIAYRGLPGIAVGVVADQELV